MSTARATTSRSARRPSAAYPKKLFYRIQEVAEITGLKPYVLRYWETQFKQLSPEKDAGDQRRYRQSDIDLVLRIRELLYDQKYTIAGARQHIKRKRSPGETPRVALPAPELASIREELNELLNELSA